MAGLALLGLIGCGATDAQGRLDSGGLRVLQGDWQQFFPAPPLKIGDLLGSCMQQQTMVVPLTQTCQLVVRSSSERVRRARFDINPTGQARLFLRQPDSITIRKDLNATHPTIDLDVFERSGTLVVVCLATNPCRVTLEEQ